MRETRHYLEKGTRVQPEYGGTYEITGSPIGEGAISVIYPAIKLVKGPNGLEPDGLSYAIKECFPHSSAYPFYRNADGEIVPETAGLFAQRRLAMCQDMLLSEKDISQKIYLKGSHVLPILETARRVTLTAPDGTAHTVSNTVTVMESLSEKGRPLSDYIRELRRIPLAQAFQIIRQVLLALREIHEAGYLHLDLQAANVYVRGAIGDGSAIISIIDFGSARKVKDGLTAPITDRNIFVTESIAAPEILNDNDGTLRLGPEADIYSVGCLLLYMLFGESVTTRMRTHDVRIYYTGRRQLAKIKCPRHLQDSLRRILQRALAISTDERYHSVEEMLLDTDDFLEAVSPHRSDLAGVRYDAFVCYKHGEIDSRAARLIQHELEHFRAPRGISQKKHPIGRVFVDEGELSSCGDFGAQIDDSLKNSGWLIVVCSPDTPGSQWVQKEIDTFLNYHDRSRILAVMTSGTPEASFPEGLVSPDGEVFAADARGENLSQIKRRIKSDALLRLAAPILGTTYDTLKNRRRIYRAKQLAALSTMAALLLAAFLTYAFRQNRLLDDELTRTQINESRYLAQMSENALDSGDREFARELALEALPASSGDDSRPVTPEAVNVLANSVYAYTPSDFNFMQTIRRLETDAAPNADISCVSPGESTFLTPDASGKLRIFDLDTGDTILELTAVGTGSAIYSAAYLTDDSILLYLDDCVRCVNVDSGESLWETAYAYSGEVSVARSDYDRGTATAIAPDGSMFYAAMHLDDVYYLYVIDASTGSIEKRITLNDDYLLLCDVSSCCISEDGRYVAVSFSCTSTVHDGEHDSVIIYDTKKDQIHKKALELSDVCDMLFLEDDSLVVMSSIYDNNPYQAVSSDWNVVCIDEEGKLSWTYEHTSVQKETQGHLLLQEDNKSITAQFGSDVIFLSGDSGSELSTVSLPDSVVGLGYWNPSRLCAALSDGTCYWIWDSSSQYEISNSSSLDGDFSNGYFLPVRGEFLLMSETEAAVYELSFTAGDTNINSIDANIDGDSFDAAYFIDEDGESWRVVESTDHLYVYKPQSDTACAEYPGGGSISQICGIYKGVLFFMQDGVMHGLMLSDSSVTLSAELPSDEDIYQNDSWYPVGQAGSKCYLYNYFGAPFLYVFDMETGKTEQISPSGGSSLMCTRHIAVSDDGKYIAVITVSGSYASLDDDENNLAALCIYNTENQSWTKVSDSSLDLSIYSDTLCYTLDPSIAFYASGHELAICCGESVALYDIDTSDVLKTLDISCNIRCRLLYVKKNRLLVWADSGVLTLWDTSSGDMLAAVDAAYDYCADFSLLRAASSDKSGESGASDADIADDTSVRTTAGCLSDDSCYITFAYVGDYSDSCCDVWQITTDDRIQPYLNLRNSVISLSAREIFYKANTGGSAGFYKLYTLDELIARAAADIVH